MELPHLGKHCSKSECKTLDFLPVECSYCNQIFCKEHFQTVSHNCKSVVDNVVNQKKDVAVFKCSSDNCDHSDPLEMKCTLCEKHYCLKHRHHGCQDMATTLSKREKYRLPKEQFRKAKAATDLQIQEKLKAAKNRSLANKIKLMKIKSTAKGAKGIPTTNRMYFLVAPPLEEKDSSCAKSIFIDKNFNIGKAIDAFSKILKVDNKNNQPDAPQLRLFTSMGEILSDDLSMPLQNLLEEGSLIDGDSVILEYINKSELEDNVFIFDGFKCLNKFSFV